MTAEIKDDSRIRCRSKSSSLPAIVTVFAARMRRASLWLRADRRIGTLPGRSIDPGMRRLGSVI